MDPTLRRQIDALFTRWQRPDRPGLAVGVYQDGELVYGNGFGSAHLEQRTPITVNTVFHVASLSKQFTAVVAAMLARAGHFALDDDLHRIIPELPAGPPITFRHAIHHTSGLREQWDLLRLAGWRDADLKTSGDIMSLMARQGSLNFPPGSRFQYINTAYTAIAVAIERITGQTLRVWADRLLFTPLGMRQTLFLDDHTEIVPDRAQAYGEQRDGRFAIAVPHFETNGPTNLYTTISDLTAWERHLTAPTSGVALIDDMATPGRFAEGATTDYGLGVIVGHYGAHATVEHAGGDAGFRAYYLRIPKHRFAVAIFANVMEVGPGRIARQIVDICRPQPDGGPVTSYTPPLDSKLPELDRVGGRYRHEASGLTCRVELRSGRLFLESNGASYELVATGGLGFRFLDLDVDVAFTLPPSGPALSMSVRSAGNTTNMCDRMDLGPEPSVTALTDYTGGFYSDELDAGYNISLQGDVLLMRGPRALLIRLRRLRGDSFAAMDTTVDVQFHRNAAHQVDGYLLSSERAWNIGFSRA